MRVKTRQCDRRFGDQRETDLQIFAHTENPRNIGASDTLIFRPSVFGCALYVNHYNFERWELGADAFVAPDDLPVDLRRLAPMLRRWAFTSQSRRDDFVERLSRRQPEGVDAFCKQMNEFQDALRAWLVHVLKSDARPPETASTVAYALQTFDLVKPVDLQKVAEFQIGMQAAKEIVTLKNDLYDANIAFSERRYDSVVELLSRHENDLDDLASRKLAFAKMKAAQQQD